MVKTFYGYAYPTLITSDAVYANWLAANTPWLLQGNPDPPNTRAYLGLSLYLKRDAKMPTPLAVLKLWQPNFQTCVASAANATNYTMVKVLVENNFDIKKVSGYTMGAFYYGGLDPVEGRTKANPPPPAASGKAFLTAAEPEYRAMIVSNP
jgi:hypothetical protein